MNQNDKTYIFINKARKIHDFKYDYSLVYYLKADKQIKIICPKHGIFLQTPNSHLSGCGCKICFNDQRKLTFEKFLETCFAVHGSHFDYSKTIFETTKDKSIIICKIHGEFLQKISSHLNGNGCYKCKIEKQSSTRNYVVDCANKIHNFKYDYSLVKYENNHTKIDILCPDHGVFAQTMRDHLSGRGCPLCKALKIGNLKRKSLKDFIKQISVVHNYFYDYSLVDYKNNHTKIKIICPEHGLFEQKALHHLNGSKCPLCSHKNISKLETEWLDSLNILKENRNKILIINGQKYNIDGYNSDTNTIYEFYGDFWHGNINVPKYSAEKFNVVVNDTFGNLYIKTINREKNLKSAGFNVITIWENDWLKLRI